MSAPAPSPLDDFAVVSLNALSLAGSGISRRLPLPKSAQSGEVLAAHDADTIWYDAVQADGRLVLVCPKLLNLRTLLNDGALKLDGHPARIRRVLRFRRHDLVDLGAAKGQHLTLGIGRWRSQTDVTPDQTLHFAGMNASVHISRNNRLEWIADWARYHVAAHGLEAMLVMDNGSDAYPPEAILEALVDTGLRRALVLVAPQKYGPQRSKHNSGQAKYLQPALLNLARLRFMARARGVLNVDIDELVWSRDGTSVFDACRDTKLGYLAFKGLWRMPGPDVPEPSRHRDHTWSRKDDKACPTKYCIRPDGLLGRISWDVHRLEAPLPVPQGWLARNDFGYWHCRAITTNWKGHKRNSRRNVGQPDPDTQAALTRFLPL